jgi:molybdopterin converting factor small subunit
MGLCQGQSCGRLISRIISDETGIPLSEIPPMRKRQPVNPVTLGEMAAGAERISIHIRYLNILRSAAGIREETLQMEAGSLVSDLLNRLAEIHGRKLAEKIFADDGRVNPLLRIARDEHHLLSGHDEPLYHGSRYDVFIATFGG